MAIRLSWQKIAEIFRNGKYLEFDEFSGDYLERSQEKWDELIDRLCGSDGDGDGDGDGSDPTKKCWDECTPEGITHSELDAALDELCAEFTDTGDTGDTEETHETPAEVPAFKAFCDTLTHFSDKNAVSTSLEAQFTSNCVRKDGSKVQLKDTNADVRPRVMAFESDTLTIEQQEENIKSGAWSAKVFSGNKSLHVLVEVPDDVSRKLDAITSCDKVAVWHSMYSTVASMLFKDTSHLDMQCKSWLRKFRTPDGIRRVGDTYVKQAAEFNSHPEALLWESILTWSRDCVTLRENEERRRMQRLSVLHSDAPKDVSTNKHVRQYLDTPYTQLSGNGCSDSRLYKALLVCKSANDDKTLQDVLAKAKSEKWREKELQRKLRDVAAFLAKRMHMCE